MCFPFTRQPRLAGALGLYAELAGTLLTGSISGDRCLLLIALKPIVIRLIANIFEHEGRQVALAGFGQHGQDGAVGFCAYGHLQRSGDRSTGRVNFSRFIDTSGPHNESRAIHEGGIDKNLVAHLFEKDRTVTSTLVEPLWRP